MRVRWRIAAAVNLAAALSSLLTACAPSDDQAAAEGRATVVEVIDGDTVTVRIAGGEESVRLIGIDTPETKAPGEPVECFGPEAAAYTASLLPPGTEVRLVRDVEARDRFDRLLAYVYRAADDAFVNAALVRDGYADLLTIEPNTAHEAELRAYAEEARAAGRGLWTACP